jgi:hypothetical protein
MYIRWQTRARTRPQPGRHHRCLLVEAVRIDGKPTQRHLAYLGGITDSASAAQRRVFWENVDASLLKLKLPTAERQRLEAAIAVKVPRPRQRIPLEEPLPQPRPITKRR